MTGAGNLLTIFRRETAAYFNAAIAYIFIIVFVLLNSGLFMTQFFIVSRADMRAFFGGLPFFLSVFLPAVTMRLWAEEKKGNTLELLLTFPMRPHELVLGKFFAAFTFYLAALAATLSIPVMLQILGNPDVGAIVTAYFGAALLGAYFLAIGLFISGLCRDQIVAFILAMMICFSLHLMGTEFIAASVDGWLPGAGTLLRNFAGSARHYDSFARGVIDNRDVLYFVIGTAIFLVLNGFWMEGRMRPRTKTIFTTAVAISAGILILGNWFLSSLPLGRFDLTEGRIYTISPATKKILHSLKTPVTAKFYVSPVDKMPTGMKTLEQDVIDTLDEFRVASKGNFQYKIFHMEAANVVEGAKPGADSLEQQLSRKGIQPFQVQSIESDEVGVTLIYSSISLAYKEKPEELIARVMPDNLHELEYRLISKIYRMTLTETPKITLLAPYREKEVEPELAALLTQLGGEVPEGYREDNYELVEKALEYEGYKVTRLNKLDRDHAIPEGTKTLLVMEPVQLEERERYEINRFLRSGGSLFLAVQNYEYKYLPSGRELQITPEEKQPGINALLEQWGFTVDEQILLDEQHDIINLSGAARLGPFEMSIPVKIPTQILITESGMNQDVSITSRLSTLFYLWGTAVKINDEKIKSQNLDVKTLLSSSKKSWTVPFRSGALTPRDLEPQAEGRKGPLPVAVLAAGQFADVFEGKTVPDWPKPETPEGETQGYEPEKPTSITPAPGKLILVGAATFLQKHLIRSGGHLNLLLNSVDSLSLGEELITVRSKQPVDRTISRVSAPAKIGWRFFVTLLTPALIAAIGAFRVILRRQSKQNYMKALTLAGVS